MPRTNLFATLVLALLATIAIPLQAADRAMVNGSLPDVALTDGAGSVHRLSEYKGQVLLIDFWASWCIPCKASFPQLDALHKEFKDKGVTVLAVNLDEQRKAADLFLSTRPHTMPVVFDPAGRAAETFGLKGMPSSVIVDRKGIIRFIHMGYTEKTLAQYRVEIAQLLGERN